MDTDFGMQKAVQLQAGSAYEFTVEVEVSRDPAQTPVTLDVLWRTTAGTAKWSPLSGFYLFDSATEINNTPFPVTVKY